MKHANTTFPIAVIVSEFNEEITRALKEGALTRLKERGFQDEEILCIEVPGAIEIPLTAKRIAMSGKVKSIITLGAVIRGETSHYDLVCEQVSQGCQRVSLDHNIPVIFGVLTTENETQAWDRLGGRHGHKGIEVVDCALRMHALFLQLG